MKKTIRKEALRKLLAINTKYFKEQNRKIDSLESRLEIMIKERNKYKGRSENIDSLKRELKIVTQEKNKLARAYAKKLGVFREKPDKERGG